MINPQIKPIKMQTFKKRDRVVTPDGLGHVIHVYGNRYYAIKHSSGSKSTTSEGLLRPATSKDFKKGKAEIYQRADGKWDYRIIQKNGNLLASSKQGYQNRVDMIKVLNNNFIDFEIVQK